LGVILTRGCLRGDEEGGCEGDDNPASDKEGESDFFGEGVSSGAPTPSVVAAEAPPQSPLPVVFFSVDPHLLLFVG